jgi:TRAP-type C4-dicarboxylate transport system permease small subunit
MSPNEKTNGWPAAKRFLTRIDNGLIFITGVALVILTFMIAFDVVSRFVFNYPLPATTEASELLMAYIVFLTLGYTLTLGLRIRITVLFEYIPSHWKAYFDLLSHFLGFAFCALTTWYSWSFFMHSFSIREEMLAVVPLPWYVGKFAMPVGFFFFTLHFIIQFIETAGKLLDKSTA